MEPAKLPTLFSRDDEMFSDLRREIDRVFSNFTRGFPTLPQPWGGPLRPSMDVKDAGKAIEVSVELPGLAEPDVEVSITDRTLTVSGEKKTEEERKEANYQVMERSYGKFSRSLTLPFAPDPKKVSARFEKGVLTVSVTKPKEAVSETRKIPVKGKD